jgi:thiamine pyrophosphate-dependent acetolactate synthase large subunit-like protein
MSGKNGRMTTADVVVDRLLAWNVEVVFGLPGDGINGYMEALRQRQERIQFVQVRHEEAAAFMASGYAKFTGKLGVCIATSGPGAIHLLNGLYDAKMDGAPVLALTGQTYHDLLGMRYQQEVDLLSLFKDVSVFNQQILGPGHAASLIDEACRAALGSPGVAHVSCPVDIQDHEIASSKKSKKKIPGHTSALWSPPITVPCAADLERAADVLNAGSRTVILAGRGSLGARAELESAAEILGAPIVKPLLGKSVVPDESPYTTGGIGLLGTLPSELAMEECDTLLMVGTSFPYMEFYPKPGSARGVQIDRDPTRIGLRFPIEVGLVGDALATLRELLPLLRKRENRDFLELAQRRMQDWRNLMLDRASRTDDPLKPQLVAHALNDVLDDDAVIAGDTGTVTTWLARHIHIRGDQRFACSGNLATMAPGLPYAIAAQTAWPHRQVVAVVGDGGFTMLMGELSTAVKYALPIVIIIFKNNSYGMIKWEQMVFLGNPEYACELQPIDFVKFAEACGATGLHCETASEVAPVLRAATMQAKAQRKPVVVEALVDPFEPPHPAQVKIDQAVHMAEALAKGEPNRGRIALTLFRDKVHDLF